jgi:hypothetical protein
MRQQQRYHGEAGYHGVSLQSVDVEKATLHPGESNIPSSCVQSNQLWK